MIRFVKGVPKAMWFSQHAEGEAFEWSAVEKCESHPVVYVANGTHALYATSGMHKHSIPHVDWPFGPFIDYTDKCDHLVSADTILAYDYDLKTQTFTPYNAGTPVNWLYFQGHWGDAQLPDSDPAQINAFGQRKYVSGPRGPMDKRLGRKSVCLNDHDCVVRPVLPPHYKQDECGHQSECQ